MNERFYVYVYLDQRKSGEWHYKDKTFHFQPFYVGRGTNKRDIEHLCPYMLARKSHKSSTIKSIIGDTGQLPIHYRVYENISSQDAAKIEIDFIKHFGRRDIGTGILCNHTDGGDGSHNLPPESKRRINSARKRKVYQYLMDGRFVREWASLTDVENEMNIVSGNISTAIKRGGSCYGFLWSYEHLGRQIQGKIKYQMPVKYKDIKQISIKTGDTINVHEDAKTAAASLNLTNDSARCKILDCINGKLKTAYGYKWSL